MTKMSTRGRLCAICGRFWAGFWVDFRKKNWLDFGFWAGFGGVGGFSAWPQFWRENFEKINLGPLFDGGSRGPVRLASRAREAAQTGAKPGRHAIPRYRVRPKRVAGPAAQMGHQKRSKRTCGGSARGRAEQAAWRLGRGASSPYAAL